MSNILQRDGLTIELLQRLSYKSALGISLKKNLHYFDRDALFMELIKVNEWYDEYAELHELALDYRIKSIQSAIMKYNRYYPDHQARKRLLKLWDRYRCRAIIQDLSGSYQ